MSNSPYQDLDPRAYWRTGVSQRSPLEPGDLYHPKFPMRKRKPIVTIGSCFAQHIGRNLRQAGFNVMDGEPLHKDFPDELAAKYGYRLFSARYANVYTARQFRQLLDEADGTHIPSDRVWKMGERFVDAQRPGVEPDGLPDEETVLAHREAHLRVVKDLFTNASTVVFTFGLTEAWQCKESGTVFPTAPGTIAGTFDPERYEFVNFNMISVFKDFQAIRRKIMEWAPGVKFLITVSPVPLTATASGQHVEVASSYSKSVLRAVCGLAYERFNNVDYFPSYEIITSQNARGAYYEPNMRSVSAKGVETAMNLFMTAHGITPKGAASKAQAAPEREEFDDEDLTVCEESLLEAFAK